VYGLEIKSDSSVASEISAKAFENGLVIETCGSMGQVVKFLPPLTIDEDTLNKGLDIVESAIEDVIHEKKERLTKEF
jgi:diaminobutyrate-2-oxoglutarate transaminase